jgi:hypothetical protein
MRLIDADALPISFDGHTVSVWKKDLDAAPTINPYEWISVEDRLPTEADGTVLVCMPDVWPYNNKEPFVNAKHDCRVMEAHYSEFSNTWTYGMGSRSMDYNPTHWMPLPKPPTEKEN